MSKVKGKKYDLGKREWHLLPIEEVEDIVDTLMVGAKSYGDFNWQGLKEGKKRYYNAAMRHIQAWKKGQRNDPDDNLPHMAHAACCLLFLAWFDKNNKGE